MLTLPQKASLSDFQNYVKELEQERGFSHQTLIEKSLLLGEEVGELFKAVRKYSSMKIATDSIAGNLSDEIADILIYLCAIANRADIDIEEAFRKKEEINKTRVWKV